MADDWIGWSGSDRKTGLMPVDSTARLDVKYRNGDIVTNVVASRVDWLHVGDNGFNIVAYRHHRPAVAEKPVPLDDGWTEWKGGERPVPKVCFVAVRWRNGRVFHRIGAGEVVWMHANDQDDVVAYRVIDEADETPTSIIQELAPSPPDTLTATLTERGSRYGVFTSHAEITQKLKRQMQATPGWHRLDDDQRETLDMVAHKIGRILNGDPKYADSWVDIAGYAKLISDRLEGVAR